MKCYREHNNQHRLDMHPFITRTNILNTRFAIRTLVYHMERSSQSIEYFNLRLLTLLSKQHLTAKFCVTYILDEEWATCNNDTWLTTRTVLHYQPHITEKELDYECNVLNRMLENTKKY